MVSHFRVSSKSLSAKEPKQASSPPRGWNSSDSFSWTIFEEEFLQNAEIISERLLPHKYKYVVVDYLWYRRMVKGACPDSLGFDVIDEWGRMAPDPKRWPSFEGGKGFTKVAKKVHRMGLKFGIHVMRGISTQSVNANTPILDINTGRAYEEFGQKWYAKDIGIKERACAWMPNGFISVDTKLGAGRAFLRSLYEQYAEWGVDFVKHDCVFGNDLDINEITYVSEFLKQLDRPILYSLSPGTGVTPSMAKDVSGLVNMYCITGDDWDTWGDVAAHFNITRTSRLLPDEQRTQMTLWSMAKSPLMFGGDFPYITSTKNFKSIDGQSGRYLTDVSTSDTHVLSLTSCTNSKAIGWSIKALDQDLEQICWKEHLGSKHQEPFGLHKKEPQFSS
nr:alpha-galactosidase mel1 [Quercus suber]